MYIYILGYLLGQPTRYDIWGIFTGDIIGNLMWIQKQQDMILCGLGTWTNYGSPPLRWEKWWRSLRLGTLCSDPFSWNQWKWGNFSPGNEGLTDKMEIFYQGDWTNRVMKNQRTTSFFMWILKAVPGKSFFWPKYAQIRVPENWMVYFSKWPKCGCQRFKLDPYPWTFWT
jgi:hypothetical protein